MIKKQKGITMVSLIITIALMAIISTTTVTISMDRFEINKFNKMKTDIELLLDKVSNYYLRYGALPILRNSTDNAVIAYPKSELDFVNQDTTTQYYILDLEAMEGISLNYGKSGFNYWKNYAQNINNSDDEAKKDIYIISSDTHNVYYVKGMKLKNRVYHYAKANNGLEDTIPPSTPQIKLVSGIQNNKGIYTTEVELEIVPGKEDGKVAKKTEISTDNGGTWTNINRLANNIYKITSTGEHIVQVRSYDKNDNISENSMELSVEIRKRKTLTAYSENQSWLDLPKSLEGTVSQFRIYGNSVQELLPSQYQQVEYIESTGTQYIDTELKPTNLTKVEIEFMYNELDGFVYGSRTSASSNDAHSFIINISSVVYPQFNGQQSNVGSSYNKTNTKYNLVNSQDGAYINNELIKSYTQSNFTSNYSIYLFALNQGNNLESRTFKGRIYGCKIWDDGRIVRNMIPCYRKSDNVIGMYDLVNGVFYTNAGTETFLKGTNITDVPTPTPEAPIEIQSVGDLVTDTTDANYGKYKIPVKVSGKNLIKPQDIFSVNTTGNSYSELVEDGRNTVRYMDAAAGRYTGFKFKENTQYTVSAYVKTTIKSSANTAPSAWFNFFYTDGTKSVSSINRNSDWTYKELTSTAGKTVQAIGIASVNYTNWIYVDIDTFQIEEGSTVTDYEPYVEPVTTNIYLSEPLRKIGDYADYIDFSTGKVVRKVRSLNLNISDMNNSETYPGWTSVEYLNQDYQNYNDIISNVTVARCNISNSNGIGINTNGTNAIVFLETGIFNLTQTEWKETYPNLEVNICYALKTPDDTETIELPELTTFNEYTKIEVLTGEVPSKIEAEYNGYEIK